MADTITTRQGISSSHCITDLQTIYLAIGVFIRYPHMQELS
jgi:hypothetical protein